MNNRRKFLKNSFFSSVVFASAYFLSACSSSSSRQQDAPDLKNIMVEPSDPLAKSMRYVSDARTSTEAKGNKCATCQHFTEKNDYHGKKIGTCNIFQNKYVYSESFCIAWAQR